MSTNRSFAKVQCKRLQTVMQYVRQTPGRRPIVNCVRTYVCSQTVLLR